MAVSELSFHKHIEHMAHPIDLVEHIAHERQWMFNRCAENKVSLCREGLWRDYAMDLCWVSHERILQLICAFDLKLLELRANEFYKMLNLSNMRCFTGSFVYCNQNKMAIYRYGLMSEDGYLDEVQIERMIEEGFCNLERFFPAFQLVNWGGSTADDALKIAFDKIYGHA